MTNFYVHCYLSLSNMLSAVKKISRLQNECCIYNVTSLNTVDVMLVEKKFIEWPEGQRSVFL